MIIVEVDLAKFENGQKFINELRKMEESNIASNKEKLLLVSMPFSNAQIPSIQLGTLSSYLRQKGIQVDVNHAFLRCADILGHDLYHKINHLLRDEIFYPCFLFPTNYERYRDKIENRFAYFFKEHAPLEAILDSLRSFNKELLAKIDYSQYSLIGFSLTFDQLKSSLYLTREIKQRIPHIQIVFGGALCTGKLGISLLKTFPEIDFIVSGEGEETLATLLNNLPKREFGSIKGLGWRDNGTVVFNGPPDAIPLDTLPFPDFYSYFDELDRCSPEFQQSIRNMLSLPIEGSRGCWWGKCTFCNLNSQYIGYKEKSVDHIVSEVKEQVRRYHCNCLQFMDNVQRMKNFDKLMSKLSDLDKDLNFYMEMRANRPEKEHYRLMSEAGVKAVQLGVEAFSNKVLKKMNKGVTVIENIAAIKYCQEFGILPYYNIIINYPGEDNEDETGLLETRENVKYLKGLIPPVFTNPMGLYYGTPVYNNPEAFNIGKIELSDDAVWRFPQKLWKDLKPFYFTYTYANERKDRTASWEEIFSEWMMTGEERIAAPLLSYQDAGDFLILIDRLKEKPYKTILRGVERELYIFCDSIQTRSSMVERFSSLSPNELDGFLEKWIANRWIYREGEKFLSLAVKVNPLGSKMSFMVHLKRFPERWSPPPPYREGSFKIGSVADINFSIDLKKKPAWLRRLKKIVSRK